MYFYLWWVVRVPVLLILPFLLYDIEILFLLSSFLFVHLLLGLKTILNDYLHNKTSKLFLVLLVRLANFEFLRYILEFLI